MLTQEENPLKSSILKTKRKSKENDFIFREVKEECKMEDNSINIKEELDVLQDSNLQLDDININEHFHLDNNGGDNNVTESDEAENTVIKPLASSLAKQRDPEDSPEPCIWMPHRKRTLQGFLVKKTPGGSLPGTLTSAVGESPSGRVHVVDVAIHPPLCADALEQLEVADEQPDELDLEHDTLPEERLYAAPSPDAGPSFVASVSDGSDLDSDFDDEFLTTEGSTDVYNRDIPNDDELDSSLRENLNRMTNIMDDYQSDLLGVDGRFDWSEDFSSFRAQREIFRGPVPGPTEVFNTCSQAFLAIWDEKFVTTIAEQTNKYAQQVISELRAKDILSRKSRIYQWHDTSAQELYVFFALQILMGLDPRPNLDEYWRTDFLLEMPNFRTIMSNNRYILLNKFLHFVDNADASQSCLRNEDRLLPAKLYKLAPVVHHLNSKFQSLYNLGPHISIDEYLTLFKGRLSWIQAIRSKAARFGIKSFEICESDTGYLYKFFIYTGKDDPQNQTVALSADLGEKTTEVVLELLKGLENRGHLVTMDNFFNSPAFARYLKSVGFDCLGTLRPNRKNVPGDVSKLRPDVARGTIVARHSGDVTVLAWKDIKLVNVISTCHDATTYVGRKAGKNIVKPLIVRDYNRIMEGVDLKDQKLSMFLMERRRGLKWYHKMYKRLMNASVLNAFILCRSSRSVRDKPVMTHRQFRYTLAEELIRSNKTSSIVNLIAEPADTRLRRDILHMPRLRPSGKKRRCAVCSKQKQKRVLSECVTCDKGLCFEPCWGIYHSPDYNDSRYSNIS